MNILNCNSPHTVRDDDPNGSILAYRRERDRREFIRTLIFVVASVCALVLVACAAILTLSLAGR